MQACEERRHLVCIVSTLVLVHGRDQAAKGADGIGGDLERQDVQTTWFNL